MKYLFNILLYSMACSLHFWTMHYILNSITSIIVSYLNYVYLKNIIVKMARLDSDTRRSNNKFNIKNLFQSFKINLYNELYIKSME